MQRQTRCRPVPHGGAVREVLTDSEIFELARVFSDRFEASRLLGVAGLPRDLHPGWAAQSALIFWREVARILKNGALVDGASRVLQAAHAMYPANPVFAEITPVPGVKPAPKPARAEEERWDFFLSYAEPDRAWAEWIAWTLEDAGYSVLVHAWDLVPGSNWISAMDRGLKIARRTIAVISAVYIGSVFSQAEWQAAFHTDPQGITRNLIPVRVEQVGAPGLLGSLTGIDLFALDEAVAAAELLEQITFAISGRGKPTTPPAFPTVSETTDDTQDVIPSMLLRTTAAPSFPNAAPGESGARRVPLWAKLPPLPPVYVARNADVDRVVELLTVDGAGPVRLVGMGGAGKTTVARLTVHDPRIQRRFEDGVVWVDVGTSGTATGIQTEVLRAFGDLSAARDRDEALTRLTSLLTGARCLVVLDDVWSSDLVAALPRLTGVRVLVTARRHDVLADDVPSTRIHTVDDATARQMLAAYARCPVEDLPPPALTILRHCAGLPLALAVSGAMVAGFWAWEAVAAAFEEAALAAIGAELSEYPHPSLWLALDVSMRFLPPGAAKRLTELAVFKGRKAIPASVLTRLWQQTGELDTGAAADVPRQLARASLIEIDQHARTVTVHDLVLDFVRVRLPAGRVEQLHGIVADGLLDRWGGLDGGLPGIHITSGLGEAAPRSDPWGRSVSGDIDRNSVDQYSVDSLVIHLLAAGRLDAVDQLLAAEGTSQSGGPQSLWFAVHDRLGLGNNYRRDVEAAWQDARTRQESGDADALARQVTYAMILGSLVSVAANIPPALLLRRVKSGRWTPIQAFDRATAIPALADRAEALAGLASHLPINLLGPARKATAEIKGDPAAQIRALAGLAAAHLAGEREPILEDALSVVGKLPDPAARSDALVVLAPLLSGSPLDKAIDVAASIDTPAPRAVALTALALRAPELPSERRAALVDEALSAAISFTEATDVPLEDPRGRATAQAWPIVRLAASLGADQLARALAGAIAIANPFGRAEAIAGLAPHLPDDLLWQALPSAAIPEHAARARALTGLLPHMPARLRRQLLDDALAAVAAISTDDSYGRSNALIDLAPHLPEQRLGEALLTAININYPFAQAEALAGFAPCLPPDLLDQALDAALTVSDPWARTRAIAGLAPYLPAPQRERALAAGMGAATGVTGDQPYVRAKALLELAPVLKTAARRAALIEALNAAAAIPFSDPDGRVEVIRSLAGQLPDDLLDRALSVLGRAGVPAGRAIAVAALSTHLPDSERCDAVNIALDALAEIDHTETRADGLAQLAQHAPDICVSRVIVRALAAMRSGPALHDSYERAGTLIALAPHLDAGDFDRVLASIAAIGDRRAAALAFEELAPDVPEHLLGPALNIAIGMTNLDAQARAISALASQLPARLIERALTHASQISIPDARAEALAGLLGYLPEHQRAAITPQVLAAASGISSVDGRVRALVSLAPRLSPGSRDRAIRQAFDAAVDYTPGLGRELALRRLAPLLPADLLDAALTAAAELPEPAGRASVLIRLTPRLSAMPELLNRALAIAREMDSPADRATALTGIAGQLSADRRALVFGEALKAGAGANRTTVVTVVIRLLDVAGTAGAAPTAAGPIALASLRRVQRWWP